MTAVLTKSEVKADDRFARSPYWIAQKADAEHRAAIRCSSDVDVSDDWLDDLEGEDA